MKTYTHEHKVGETFSFAGTAMLPAGTWSARSKIAKPANAAGDLAAVEDLDVTIVPPAVAGDPHQFLAVADAAATLDWPLVVYWDIVFFDASVPPVQVPSPTVRIVVQRSPSNAQ